jgi:serine/threonine-protein kinase
MNHPAPDRLRKFLAEEISLPERDEMERHINECDCCLEYLDSLERDSRVDTRVLASLLINSPAAVSASANGQDMTNLPAGEDASGSSNVERSKWPTFAGYELLERVSSGGMGEIYRARQQTTNRIVALKTLLASRCQDTAEGQEVLARFRTEIEAVSRLQHANIVPIYDVGERDGRPFYTMQWLGGGSLAEKLAGRPQEERQSAQWLATLSRAVRHIHENGIIHRDLKPGNLLLADDGTIKIADFGVAKLTDKSTGVTQIQQWFGTPEYMAPEQTATEEAANAISPATDVYALGVLLYEMLTGRPPFRAHEPLETLRQVRAEEPISPRHLRPRLSRDLETICLKCLNKDPTRRYQSAKLLADDLDRWLEGRPILARPAGSLERATKWAKRHPERAIITAVAALAAFFLVVAFFWQLWLSNARYARQLADSADYQLLLVKYAVSQTAQDAELRELLSDPQKNQARLRAYLVRTKEAFVRWFTRPGENVPIINWFVMDAEGTILADSYEDPNSVGKNYRFRDYYRRGIDSDIQGRHGVYVSRVYESEQDDRFKFTAMTRIEGPGALYGLLGASLAVDSKLVALDMKKEAPGAIIVGPADANLRAGQPADAHELPQYVVVLHRDYAVAGQKPASVEPAQLARLTAFSSDPNLREDSDKLTGRGSFLHYARVGDSEFVVMVEHPYPWPIALLLWAPLWTWLALLPCTVITIAYWRRNRHAREPTATKSEL